MYFFFLSLLNIVILFYFQVIELDLESLPEGDEVLGILTNEKVPLNYWVDLAVSFPFLTIIVWV